MDQEGRLSPGDAVWIGVIPATVVLLAALIWLAPPLSELFPEPTHHGFPSIRFLVKPEPLELTRYLLAIAIPFLLAGWLYWRYRRGAGEERGARGSSAAGYAVIAVQAAGLVFLLVCFWKQRDAPLYWTASLERSPGIFSAWSWIGAVAFACGALAIALGFGRERLAGIGRRVRQAADRKAVGLIAAVVLTVLWLLPSVLTEESLAHVDPHLLLYLPNVFGEYAAAVNGLTPYVDFISTYSFLLPVITAPAFGQLGVTVTTFTVVMVALSAVAFLAIYGLLVNSVGRRDIALGLYVAVLGIGLLPYLQHGVQRFGAYTYGVMPSRYLGPLIVGYLCTTRLRHSRWGRIAIFLAAGLTLLNNAEFGMGCFAAALIALWVGRGAVAGGWRSAAGLALEALAGLGAAVFLLTIGTLVRASSPPDLGDLFYFSKVFGREGYALLPMATLGLHIVLFASFAAAVLVAAVRSLTGAANKTTTVALAWAGCFGLFTGGYFVGESIPGALFSLFPVWGLAIALLAVVAFQSLERTQANPTARRRAVLPTFAALMVLGLMVTGVFKFPMPWTQFDRILASGPKPLDVSRQAAFVDARTQPGDSVTILTTLGHKVANRAGVKNVLPFNHPFNVKTFEQMDLAFERHLEAGATKVFVGPHVQREISAYLGAHGMRMTAVDPVTLISEWEAAPG